MFSINDNLKYRDQFIELPKEHKKVKLVGRTGSGKTTLLRQLLGTDRECFPGVDSSKTTVSELEIVFKDTAEYKIFVEFMSKDDIEPYIEDMIMEICTFYKFNKDDYEEDEIDDFQQQLEKLFIEDPSQTFKFKLLFGNFKIPKQTALTEAEISYNKDILNDLKSKIIYMSDKAEYREIKDEEEFKRVLIESQCFNNMKNDLMEKIKNKFMLLKNYDQQISNNDNWLFSWWYETPDRDKFIEIAKLLTANHYGNEGKYLTPLVKTVRIEGAFAPKWWEEEKIPNIIVFDGMGIGHVKNNTKNISDLYKIDKILYLCKVDSLDDTSDNPILEDLKKIRQDGETYKLILAATHLKVNIGESTVDVDDKIAKFNREFKKVLKNLSAKLDDNDCTYKFMNKRLKNKKFYIGNINIKFPFKDNNKYSEYSQLNDLIREILNNDEEVYTDYIKNDIIYNKDYKLKNEINFDDTLKKSLLKQLGLDKDLSFSIGNYPKGQNLSNSFRWDIKRIANDERDGNTYFHPANIVEDFVNEDIYKYLTNTIRLEGDNTEDEKDKVIQLVLSKFEVYNFIFNIVIKENYLLENDDKWSNIDNINSSNYKKPTEVKSRKTYNKMNELIKKTKEDIKNECFNKIEEIINSMNKLHN